MIAGVVGGCLCGMASWLVYASTYEGGLAPKHFVRNTGEQVRDAMSIQLRFQC